MILSNLETFGIVVMLVVVVNVEGVAGAQLIVAIVQAGRAVVGSMP